MRVFVDTNVWLSARFRPGLCSQLIETLLQSGAILLLDPRVHEEFCSITTGKLKVDSATLAIANRFFDRYTLLVPEATQPTPNIPDPDDAWILAAALSARADWFVTGDKALLDLGSVQGLPVLSPRHAYQRLIEPR